MADAQDIKNIVVKSLRCVLKCSSFVLPNDPILGFVVSVTKKCLDLVDKEENPVDKAFKEIHTNLEEISKKNKEIMSALKLNELILKYDPYEVSIKHQFSAFEDMVEDVKGDPDQAQNYKTTFKGIYMQHGYKMNLDVWYNGVMGNSSSFGSEILKVYLECCERDRTAMEKYCAHVVYLFNIGLVALMGYTAVTQDDVDSEVDVWSGKMKEIREKIQEVLSMCEDK